MGCRYSPQRSQSNGKSNFLNELTIQKFDSNSKFNSTYRQHHNVKPITLISFPTSFTERKTILVPQTITSLRNFHGLSPWYRLCSALTSCGDLQRHSDHRQDDRNGGVFATSDPTKLILGLCNTSEWWKWHRSQNLAHLDTISCVTWLIYRSHRRGGHG